MSDQRLPPSTPPTALLPKLFDSINDLVCALDAEGRFVYVNQSALKILGYQPQELIGMSCFELMIEEDRAVSLNSVEHAVQVGDDVPPFENRYRRRDGKVISLLWEGGGYDAQTGLMYSTARDVTEQRRLEMLERQYRLQLEGLLEGITDGFIGVDEDVRVIYWNKAAQRISQLPQKQMLGQILWEVLPEPTLSIARHHYAIIQQENRPVEAEYFSPRIGRWIEVAIFPSPLGLSIFFRDVTEKKQQAAQLQLEKEYQQKRITTAVVQATEEERALVGQELHDNVNQVLTTIKLYTELCLSGIENKDELQKRSLWLLQQTINEIRGLSKRLSAPSLGNILIKDSVEELVDAIRATNRFTVTYEQDINGLEVTQEVHIAVYRILQEHFTNIIKHAAASAVKVLLHLQRATLLVNVEDNGRGFDPSAHRKGIGVENMTSRAESVGGTLYLSSTLGQGCHLQVSVPLVNGI